jgi:catechol 2,3-dioxygenase-like lactoylglutathione lyase family enzyme
VENNIVKMHGNSETSKVDRRRLIQGLGLGAAAAVAAAALSRAATPMVAVAAQAVPAGTKVFPVTHVNHLSLAVADYTKSRDFYVDLFGMRVVWDDGKGCALEFGSTTTPNGMYIRNVSKPGDKPTVNHIAYSLRNFMSYKDAMKAELERRGLKNIRADSEVGWICNDPEGYMLNIVAIKDKAMFPGAAAPCGVAASAECKAAYEAGIKDLGSIPKPSGKGFKAMYYSHIVLNVPDLPKERDFYRDMFGMKVIYDEREEPNPQCFLRFGENTLYLRKTAKPDDKPYCNHFAFVVEDYEQAKVEAELTRRGLTPQPDSKLGWTIKDPDGFRLEVAGPGLPEHIAHDCHGANRTCPGGPRG